MLDVALADGKRLPLAEATLPITDEGVARRDGAFETIGVWGGRAFRPDDHLTRLAASLDAIALPVPDLGVVDAEIEALLDGVDVDAGLRINLTASGTRLLTLNPPPVRTPERRLAPQPAPWIAPRSAYRPAGCTSPGPPAQAPSRTSSASSSTRCR